MKLRNLFFVLSCVFAVVFNANVLFAGKVLSPTINLSVDAENIQIGQSATLIWTTTDAETLSVDQGIGSVELNGSITVSPSTTTIFTFTATYSSKITTKSITINVYPIPELTTLPGVIDNPQFESFGHAIAVDGDYLIAGCPYIKTKNGKGLVIGAAYIYRRDGANWIQEAKIVSPTQEHSKFGYSVDISGDYVIVGATAASYPDDSYDYTFTPERDFSTWPLGSAYIFKRNGTSWTFQTKLMNSDGAMFDDFGYSVSITDSGFAFVGARNWHEIVSASNTESLMTTESVVTLGADTSYQGVGAVYVYKNENESWVENQFITTSATNVARFGQSVSVREEWAMVGAPTEYLPEDSGRGAVYFYHYDGSVWNQHDRLSADISGVGDKVQLDQNMAIASAASTRSAIVFRYDGQQWLEQAWLHRDRVGFGTSVSIHGDMIVVGAPAGKYQYLDYGLAYIFNYNDKSWSEQRVIQGPDTFGSQVFTNGKEAFISDTYLEFGEHAITSFGETLSIYSIPSISVEANPTLINGAPSTLTWNSFNADSVTITPDIGAVATNGTIIVNPSQTTTYSFTASSPGGTVTNTATVVVGNLSLSASPDTISRIGESSILSWETTGFDTCTIDQNIGSVPLNGSITVSPTDTKTYSLTCSNATGDQTANATVGYNSLLPVISNFSANPATILRYGSATLSWDTSGGLSATIQPLGSVALSGSIVVSPSETKTYELIVRGPTGTTSQYVTITVLSDQVPPTVSIDANPLSVGAGGTTTLTWASTNAETVNIDNGIGDVSLNGSMFQILNSTTTFTITATGPGGSVSDSVTVTLAPKPIATLIVSPGAILLGGSATLAWDTTFAETVSIDNGIGDVAIDGTTSVSPTVTTTYTLSSLGDGGTETVATTLDVIDPSVLGIGIVYPAEDQLINSSHTQVWGYVGTGVGGAGVMVNGIPAQVAGSDFFVNNLNLLEGENTITVVATEPGGAMVSDTITVIVDTSLTTNRVELSLNPESGLSPLSTRLSAKLYLENEPTTSDLVCDYPDVATITKISETEYDLIIDQPGIYTLVYTINDDQGGIFDAQITVNAVDEIMLDSILRNTWNDMRNKLIAQDINGALACIHPSSEKTYQFIFNTVDLVNLSGIASNMGAIEMIYSKDNVAKFRIKRQEDVGGTLYDITYYIHFMKDEAGVWKIESF
jgi:hypothetical protein